MALQGTLDTFSLDEVLGLLAQTRKTGALHVQSLGGSGALYFASGSFCAAEAGDVHGPVANRDALEARLVDVCFALFRLSEGSFEFKTEARPNYPASDRVPVGALVAQVQAVAAEWGAVEAVIPSLEAVPRISEQLARESMTIDQAAWRVLTAVDGHRTVRDIAERLSCSMVGVSRALKDLVDAGAVAMELDGEAIVAPPVQRGPTAADLILREAVEMPVPVAEEPRIESGAPVDSAIDDDLASLYVLAADLQARTRRAHRLDDEPSAGLHPEVGADVVATPAEDEMPPADEEAPAGQYEAGEPDVIDEDALPPTDGTARDRGALLRMFSALRDK